MSGDYSSFDRPVTWGTTSSGVGSIQTQGEEIILPGHLQRTLTVPDSDDWNFTGPFCIELFGVKFDSVSVEHGLISHYNASGNQRGWALGFLGQNSPKDFRVQLSTDGTAVTILDGEFEPTAGVAYDLCCERDGSDVVRLYADGVMVASVTFAGTIFNNAEPVEIGTGLSQTANPWSGRFKAVRITRAARYASDGGYVVPSLPLPTRGA